MEPGSLLLELCAQAEERSFIAEVPGELHTDRNLGIVPVEGNRGCGVAGRVEELREADGRDD